MRWDAPTYDVQRQPVPESGGKGYYAARYVGGPLMRLLEMPQQVSYGALLSLQGRSLDDWNILSPMARILFPGQFGRVPEEMITGTDNLWANLAVGVVLDPINFVGVGAITKLGKSKQLLRGITSRDDIAKNLSKLIAEENPQKLIEAYSKTPGTFGAQKLQQHVRHLTDVEQQQFFKELADPEIHILGRYPHRQVKGGITPPPSESKLAVTDPDFWTDPKLQKDLFPKPEFWTPEKAEFKSFYSEINPKNFGNSYKQQRDVSRWLQNSADRNILEMKLEMIGATPDDFDTLKPILDAFDIRGGEVLDEYSRFSSRLRSGEAHLLGAGSRTGWGGMSDFDLLERFRLPAADVVESLERGWHQGIEKFIKRGKLEYTQPMLRKTAQGFQVIANDDVAEVVKKTNMAHNADVCKEEFKHGGVISDFAERFEESGLDPRELLARAESSAFSGDPERNPVWGGFIGGFRDFLRKGAMSQQKGRRFDMHGFNYIAREPERLVDGENIMNKIVRDMAGLSPKQLRSLGMSASEYKALAEDVRITHATTNQMARSRGMPDWMARLRDAASKKAGELKRHGAKLTVSRMREAKLAEAAEMEDVARRLTAVKKGYDIPTNVGPLEFNIEARKIFEPEITEFLKTPAAKEKGWKTIDDFNVYSEDPFEIMSKYGKRTAEAKASANTVSDFANNHFTKKYINIEGTNFESADFHHLNQAAYDNYQDVGKVVHVEKYLRELLGKPSYKAIREFTGDAMQDMYGDENAVRVFAEVMRGHMRVATEHPFLTNVLDPIQNWWARATLFGGRASYLFNNFVGDTWNAILGGVDSKYIIGGPQMQVILPEGETLSKAGFGVAGAADDMLCIPGKGFTVGEIRRDITALEIGGGVTTSSTFMATEAARKRAVAISKEIQKNPWAYLFNWKSFKEGDVVPAMRELAAFSEVFRRTGTYMHFLEQGFSKDDAAMQVWKYHFNYNKQNKTARRIAPYYFWTSSNVPLQLKNFFRQPGKQALPFKAVKAREMVEFTQKPTEEARPEYLQASGVWMGHANGKDFYMDISNLPGPAALQISGMLSKNGHVFEDVVKNIGSMASPVFQIPIEMMMNKDIFTGQAIVGGGAGVLPERGVKSFGIPETPLEVDIQGNPLAQRLSHAFESAFTPAQLVKSMARFSKDAPPAYTVFKGAFGFPIRKSDRLSTLWINNAREINKLRVLYDHYLVIGNRKKAIEVKMKLRPLTARQARYSKQLGIEEKREQAEHMAQMRK